MNVEELKREIIALNPADLDTMSVFIRALKLTSDPEYQRVVDERLNDRDPSHWLSLDEVKKMLGES